MIGSFKLSAQRHTKADKHPLGDMFRRLTTSGIGLRQHHKVQDLLKPLKFDQVFYTKTVRTVTLARALLHANYPKEIIQMVNYAYPEPDAHAEIWTMFEEAKGKGNAPNDYRDHRHFGLLLQYCKDAAKKLLEACQGKSTLLIGHVPMNQFILAEIAILLGQHGVARELMKTRLELGDRLDVVWDGKNLTPNIVRLAL
ncbi:MAG: hypothetical protein V4469_01765 [Patescibacteria group bacterium]